MNNHKKSIEQKLRAMELADQLDNITEACRLCGISRTQFYEYKRRFQANGVMGLKNLPPIHKTHPQTTPLYVEERIVDLSLKHPLLGCSKLSDLLKFEGINISPRTLQKILVKKKLGNRYERIKVLEEKAIDKELTLSNEQLEAIAKINPCFKERHMIGSHPGEVLVQTRVLIGDLESLGKLFMQVVVDTFSCNGFATVYADSNPNISVNMLHDIVLPFYRDKGLKVDSLVTNCNRIFCGGDPYLYELYLLLNNIRHVRKETKKSLFNGFADRFTKIVTEEFFLRTFQTKHYIDIEKLQADLVNWLGYYNSRRPFTGYPNMGQVPNQKIDHYLRTNKPFSI